MICIIRSHMHENSSEQSQRDIKADWCPFWDGGYSKERGLSDNGQKSLFVEQ